jgi:hypothetical protein
MALFSLTDISFKKEGRGQSKPLASSQYTIKKYPIDLGSWDKGHYMLFHINTQNKTQIKTSDVKTMTTTQLNSQMLKSLKGLTGLLGTGVANTGGSEKDMLKNNNLFRTIKRSSDAIALYMPDTLNFMYNQSYSDVSITAATGTAGTVAAAGQSLMDTLTKDSPTNLSAFGYNALSSITGNAKSAVFAALSGGLASNPQLEVLYTSPSFRSFRYSFMFYPRSEQEAKEVQDIIFMFQFHQAPEILNQSGARFLIPPSEFDIKFYYNGSENPNIPKISTCVLESIDVDYAPNGFSAYEVPGKTSPSKGETGMPVAIRLDLGFKEVDILTKQYYATNQKLDDKSAEGLVNKVIDGLK